MDSLDDVLEIVQEVLEDERRPVATTVEVADRLDVSRPTATDRLRSLVARGDVETAKLGRTRVWWPADFSPAKTPANTSTNTPAETPTSTSAKTQASTDPDPDPDAGEVSPAKTPAETSAKTPTEVDAGADEIEAVVERVSASWSDEPDRLAARREAARAALEAALEADHPVGKSDPTIQEVRDENPVSGQSPETWWRKNVRPVLSEVGEYSRGHHGYRVDSL